MDSIGLMEIFFGKPWPNKERMLYANFLRENGFGFYFYGPKADQLLRKNWAQPWPSNYIHQLRNLSEEYRRNGLKFGVVLSPFGLHMEIKKNSANLLKKKITLLSEVGVDMLGIFFDDMASSPGLAKRQVEVLNIVQSLTSIPLIFCPTFYSFDPILDKVFGNRPQDYLEEIGESVDSRVKILWTGPKVISDEISSDHLDQVARLLKRLPFICDNRFSNDGPKNCKFIKFKSSKTLDSKLRSRSSHWAFNPMNQPEISKLVLLDAKKALLDDSHRPSQTEPTWSHCSKEFSTWLMAHRTLFLEDGLDKISHTEKVVMAESLASFDHPAATELLSWLQGDYNVGQECLTD